MVSQHNQAGLFIHSLRKDCDICTELELLHMKLDSVVGGGSPPEDGGVPGSGEEGPPESGGNPEPEYTWEEKPYTSLSGRVTTYDPGRMLYVDSGQELTPYVEAIDPFAVRNVTTDGVIGVPTHPTGRAVRLVSGRVILTEPDGTTPDLVLAENFASPTVSDPGRMFYLTDSVLVIFGDPRFTIRLDRETLKIVRATPALDWTTVPAAGTAWEADPLFGDRIVLFHRGSGRSMETLLADMDSGRVLDYRHTTGRSQSILYTFTEEDLDSGVEEPGPLAQVANSVQFHSIGDHLYAFGFNGHVPDRYAPGGVVHWVNRGGPIRRVAWTDVISALDDVAEEIVLSPLGDFLYRTRLQTEVNNVVTGMSGSSVSNPTNARMLVKWDEERLAVIGPQEVRLWDIAEGTWDVYQLDESIAIPNYQWNGIGIAYTLAMRRVQTHGANPRERSIVIVGNQIVPSGSIVLWETEAGVRGASVRTS